MEEKSPLLWIFAVIAALLLGLGGGYYYGDKIGYKKAQADAKAIAEAEAKKAAEAANPFKSAATNPLENVTANPLEKVKLNPFK
ncbi:hypothetical protein HY838_01980 [Candidatus Azambacteria bacterium]|nr:hypothetical protein [Candidatus Azambacteria bacterium]